MKSKLNILLGGVIMLGAVSVFTACSDDDDFTESIFPTDVSLDYLDKSSFTFPLDTFCKKEYLEPYNMKFIYKMEDVGSDMQKNLVPAAYDKSIDLAVLSKYLWYDVYKKVAGEQFLKQYSPRIIHVIGSASYNPTSGTETLGTAEGGLKITLYKTNQLDPSDLAFVNQYFFITMHHEFGHILDQTFQRPSEFNTISAGNYDLANWGETHDSIAACRGFVSPYASSQAREDWVETMANYITMDSLSWQRLIGAAAHDWEEVDCESQAAYDNDISKFNTTTRYADGVVSRTDSSKHFYTDQDSIYYNLRTHGVNAYDAIGYLKVNDNGEYKTVRKVITRDNDDVPVPTTDWKLQYIEQDGIDGSAIILQKLELVRTWLRTNWNIDIDMMHREVNHRQYVYDNNDNLVTQTVIERDEFQHDWTRIQPVNKLIQPYDGDPSMTLIDYLRSWVNQYKALQTNN